MKYWIGLVGVLLVGCGSAGDDGLYGPSRSGPPVQEAFDAAGAPGVPVATPEDDSGAQPRPRPEPTSGGQGGAFSGGSGGSGGLEVGGSPQDAGFGGQDEPFFDAGDEVPDSGGGGFSSGGFPGTGATSGAGGTGGEPTGGTSSGGTGEPTGGSGGSGGEPSTGGAGGAGGEPTTGGTGGEPSTGGTGGEPSTGGAGGEPEPMCVEEYAGRCLDTEETNGWIQNDLLGRCIDDRCCGGCRKDGVCYPGDEMDMCGYASGACQNCDDDNECTVDSCIVLGGCQNQPRVAEPCQDGRGICNPITGVGWSCIACGHIGERCCSGGTCAAGAQCSNGTCHQIACGSVGQPCCGADAYNQGTCSTGICSNGSCVATQSCGGLNEICCKSTVTSGCLDNLACWQGKCRECGSPGQPCCPGQPRCAGNCYDLWCH